MDIHQIINIDYMVKGEERQRSTEIKKESTIKLVIPMIAIMQMFTSILLWVILEW
jgi:hypothetical protein